MSLRLKFNTFDYIICITSFGIPIFIGLYFAYSANKYKSTNEYMYGKTTWNPVWVGLSIYSSSLSAIALLGSSTEVYVFGAKHMLICIGFLISPFMAYFFINPVFNEKLNICTPYEYYELRFGKSVRYVSTVLCIINYMILMPITLYSSCLAVSKLADIDINICTTIFGGICIFYTLLGGYQAVIWCDVIQATIMLSSCVFSLIIGVSKAGGFDTVLSRAEDGGRINFNNWNLSPFERLTVWSAIIGGTFNATSHTFCSASALQRILTLRTERNAFIACIVGMSGALISNVIAGLLGLCIYAIYFECDLVKSKVLENYNQLLPHFIFANFQHLPGLSGIFVAGLISAGLSTLSTLLNTISGVIYFDFIHKTKVKYLCNMNGIHLMKLIVFIYGIYTLISILLFQHITYILSVTMTLMGVTSGAKMGLLLLGTSFPNVNSKGAISGIFCSIIFMSWIAFGALRNDVAKFYKLPVSTKSCLQPFNNTTTSSNYIISNYSNITNVSGFSHNNTTSQPSNNFILYNLSYMYYTVSGALITIIVALIVSYVTGKNPKKYDNRNYFIKFVRPKQINRNPEEMQEMVQ